jgi:hypothetical protein
MKNVAILLLVVSLCSLAPVNSYAQDVDRSQNPPIQETLDTHKIPAATTGITLETGIVAVTVTLLGLIALAASSDSGDATPATTNH